MGSHDTMDVVNSLEDPYGLYINQIIPGEYPTVTSLHTMFDNENLEDRR